MPSERLLREVASTFKKLVERVERAFRRKLPLVFGGNHSTAVGTLSGIARQLRVGGHTMGVIWVDAHADMNTPETSPSGNVRGTDGFHLSFDLDRVDPEYAPGVGTPVSGGTTDREAHLGMEKIADSGKMIAREVVEVNPVIEEVNRTAKLAVELILSAPGKKII